MIYLINLDRRPDRLKEATDELNKVEFPFHRIQAVDGNAVKVPLNFIHGKGAFGCRESHVKALDHALANNKTDITIFEDDILFKDNFLTDYDQFLDDVEPFDWQCLFLGGQHMGGLGIPRPIQVATNVVKCVNVHRTHAIRVRGEFIKTLRDIYANSLRHIDHTFGKWQSNNQDAKIYAPDNWLVGQRGGFSDIRGAVKPIEWWAPKFVRHIGTTAGVECFKCGTLKANESRPCLTCLQSRRSQCFTPEETNVVPAQ
ncbi:glycosyltransferase family 25 protein [Limnoglobus roseus]|uniref:Glycosyl transferase family 25 domain-containing protein n=1 Tax=Limnoglobus roseus TaxID=2598579 RepID=A0A5C1ACY1_9BACT|nr:glycosyltransferase family 25 protein [Limnoglobus roseus]QEL16560.1 hypothetical protein PX52LOC_03520 [Limnoglobus roseus]